MDISLVYFFESGSQMCMSGLQGKRGHNEGGYVEWLIPHSCTLGSQA